MPPNTCNCQIMTVFIQVPINKVNHHHHRHHHFPTINSSFSQTAAIDVSESDIKHLDSDHSDVISACVPISMSETSSSLLLLLLRLAAAWPTSPVNVVVGVVDVTSPTVVVERSARGNDTTYYAVLPWFHSCFQREYISVELFRM